MIDQLAEQPLPADERELEAVIRKKFLELTGETLHKQAPDGDDFVAVPELNEGGMSGGMVSREFWEERAIPELCARFRKLKDKELRSASISGKASALSDGIVDNFVSFFAGEHLEGFSLGLLPESYNWIIPGQKSLIRIFGDSLTEDDYDRLEGHGYDQNVTLKQLLHKKWIESPGARRKMARWIISDWGGIRGNQDKTLLRYVQVAEVNDPRTPIKGVASYSKLLSVAHPAKYAIYDARVAVALNAAQYLMGGERVVFPYLPGRNKKTGDNISNRGFSRQADFSAKELQRQGWTVIAPRHGYQSYLQLLNSVQRSLHKQPPLYELEMTLFSQAEKLASEAMAELERCR
ncbi:hypothetical protein SAMN04490248_1352 [Salinihabitans flavidus]|uniref:Uncharacterized protein n=1 Tax=Salinihabitans flavidus TaxID=569882 RepID=A0A1H8VUP2_9RHOB|nr:hypothetical protein [Salinihabitans flavidus]SEP19126.1 hypothetical protein SAMN04490248_1352 [Salinihabitans flavidus]